MKLVLDIIYSFIFVILCPKMFYRMFTQDRYKAGWGNRFGSIDRDRGNTKSVWIHAVSVGEVNAAKTIIDKLKERYNEYDIVISTTTDTGFARAKNLYGKDHCVIYFPMDFSFVMRRAFNTINPVVCLLMELEVWPNFASIAKQKQVPVLVVNGRISERSFPRYKKVRAITRWMFNNITLFLTQTQEYADRFLELGVDSEKIIITSSLKYDTAELTDQIAGKDELANKLCIADDMLWVAGGTGPDEEEIILNVFKRIISEKALENVRLAIIPRKPERFDEVAELIKASNFNIVRYSSVKCEAMIQSIEKNAVILGDTMGDLRKFYSLATSVFVGRSLCPMGGSDMMESTAMKKFTTFGPYTFNFNQTVQVLLEGQGAVEVANEDELYEVTKRSFLDKGYNEMIALNGQEVIRKNQGATELTLEQISKLISKESV